MSPILYYPLLIGLGILPSLIWLLVYLKKDCHPEPKSLIIKTFLMGIIISPMAIILQLLFVMLLSNNFPSISSKGPFFFFWAALVEEVVKFYAIKVLILQNPEFDEPIDAMIYMVTAALGFAAMENILVMFQVLPECTLVQCQAASVWVLRFAGATLLHTLSSAILGYFVGVSWFYLHHQKKLIYVGLGIATIFHFTFNMFLSPSDSPAISLISTTALLVIMSFLVYTLFDKLRDRSDNHKSNFV
jgi:protease PrsW